MPEPLQLATAIVVMVFLASIWRYCSFRVRRQRIILTNGCKGPTWYPHTDRVRGSDMTRLRKQAIRDGRLKMLHLEHHRQFGDSWQEKVDGQVNLYTIHRDNVKCIFSQRIRDFSWQPKSKTSTPARQLLGTGGFFGDYQTAPRARKLINPTFSIYENGIMPILKDHVDLFMDNLPRDGQTFDLQPALKRLYLDIATEFLFDISLGMQQPEKQAEAQQFISEFDNVLLGVSKRRQGFTFMTYFKFLFDRSFSRGVTKYHKFVEDLIQAAIIRNQARGSIAKSVLDAEKNEDTPLRYTLIDELVKQSQDRSLIRDTLLQSFIPARENAAIMTSNTIWAISRHPEYWHRIRPLALTLTEDECISFSKLSHLDPIRHAVFEALRLYGPGGFHWRRAVKDTVLPKGGGPDGESPLLVAKDTRIAVHSPVMRRKKSYWGEDADEYRPERFEGRNITQDYEFIPFLSGPKACPAKQQVVIQSTYILVRLLREFESIKCTDEVEHFVEAVKLTTESRRGCQIALIPNRFLS